MSVNYRYFFLKNRTLHIQDNDFDKVNIFRCRIIIK